MSFTACRRSSCIPIASQPTEALVAGLRFQSDRASMFSQTDGPAKVFWVLRTARFFGFTGDL
jgi:hypothetical protein